MRQSGVFVGVMAVLGAGIGCTKPNPEFCIANDDCPGQVCDLDRNTCVPGDPTDAGIDASLVGDAGLPDAATSLRVQVTRTGTGAGTVVSTPAGINCGTICEAVFPADTGVTLSALAADGSTFVEWTGDCDGFDDCTLPAGGTAAATASFGITGEHLFSFAAGGDDVDAAFDTAFDDDGNLLVTGTFAGTINLGGEDLVSTSLSRDPFVAKFAPDGAHIWSVRLGGADDEIGYRMDTYANGDVAVAMGVGVSFDFNHDSVPTAAHAVVRLAAADGSEIWRVDFTSSDGEVAIRDVAVDVAQNLVVTGVYVGSVDLDGDTLVNETGSRHGFVAWYDSGSAHFRTIPLSPSESVDVQSLAASPGGGVTVVGDFAGTLHVPVGEVLDSSVDGRGFVINLSSTGLNTWQVSWGADPRRIAFDGDGNTFVTGIFSSAHDFGGGARTPLGSRDIAVVSYDSGGDYRWDAVVATDSTGSFFQELSSSIAVSPTRDQVAIAGLVVADADFGGGSLPGFQSMTGFVADYDASTGAHRWSRTFGAAKGFDAFGMGVAVDSVGRVGTVGMADGTGSLGGDVVSGFGQIYVALFGP